MEKNVIITYENCPENELLELYNEAEVIRMELDILDSAEPVSASEKANLWKTRQSLEDELKLIHDKIDELEELLVSRFEANNC